MLGLISGFGFRVSSALNPEGSTRGMDVLHCGLVVDPRQPRKNIHQCVLRF